MSTNKSLQAYIEGPEEARWSIAYHTTASLAKNLILESNLKSGDIVKNLNPHFNYKLQFSEIEGYKSPGVRLIELDKEDNRTIYNFVYADITNYLISKSFPFISMLKVKKISKPIIQLNDVDLDLTVRTKIFYKMLENSAFTFKHHLEANCQLYSIPKVGKINLFLKNFAKYSINPSLLRNIEGLRFYTVPENEMNRIDLISWYHYKTPELFWVILLINDIIDPFDIPEGKVLKILPKSFIELNLLRKEDTN